MATTQELEYAVSLTLGDHPEDFEIRAIVEQICTEFGPVKSIDDVPYGRYWEIVEAHDVTRRWDGTA